MNFAHRSTLASSLVCCASLCALTGCGSEKPTPEYNEYAYMNLCGEVPTCDANVTVDAESPALIVTDPDALAALPLEDVVGKLLDRAGDHSTTPLGMLQRLFDTNNDAASAVFPSEVHCDSSSNMAHQNGPAATCPRKEGSLASSDGFFTPGHEDHFKPVAIVNRFDLATTSGGSCGEYRIVYAKESGVEDPNNRVFMIFEATLPNPNPGCLLGCRPVAEFWKGLEQEKDPEQLGQKLRAFFMEGLPGFDAPIDPENLGLGSSGGYNGGFTGQVRMSQQMDEHWELRQFGLTLDLGGLRFAPVVVGNNPMPHLFAPPDPDDPGSINRLFIDEVLTFGVTGLAVHDVARMNTTTNLFYLSGESALGGDAINDYLSRAEDNTALREAIQKKIDDEGLGADCPPDDPLTADSILARITTQSCAGCHAPHELLGPERKLGCGVTFPETLGEAQIDERGTLSPALRGVFLPHRADVLGTYLQACNEEEIVQNFGGPADGFHEGLDTPFASRPRTLGGSTTH